jgi:hypothetical protein
METHSKTPVVVILFAGLVILFLIIKYFISQGQIISPVPEDSAIKIIYISPTQTIGETLPTPTIEP